MRGCVVLLGLVAACGCQSRQPWTFHNGTGLDDTEPPLMIVEVYEGGDCGFACRPPGRQLHCEELEAGTTGRPPPSGAVRDGERYCFMGTALDEGGRAYAVGCSVATVGGGPIEVPLSPIEDGRVIQSTCQPTMPPVIDYDAGGGAMDAGRPDAGPPPGVDAGPPRDAGRLDAGPPQTDAGPGGLPFGTRITVYFQVSGPGQVVAYDEDGVAMGGVLRDGYRLELNAWVGFYVRLESTPDTGASLTTLDVPSCGLSTRCEFTLSAPETIDIGFTP